MKGVQKNHYFFLICLASLKSFTFNHQLEIHSDEIDDGRISLKMKTPVHEKGKPQYISYNSYGESLLDRMTR